MTDAEPTQRKPSAVEKRAATDVLPWQSSRKKRLNAKTKPSVCERYAWRRRPSRAQKRRSETKSRQSADQRAELLFAPDAILVEMKQLRSDVFGVRGVLVYAAPFTGRLECAREDIEVGGS